MNNLKAICICPNNDHGTDADPDEIAGIFGEVSALDARFVHLENARFVRLPRTFSVVSYESLADTYKKFTPLPRIHVPRALVEVNLVSAATIVRLPDPPREPLPTYNPGRYLLYGPPLNRTTPLSLWEQQTPSQTVKGQIQLVDVHQDLGELLLVDVLREGLIQRRTNHVPVWDAVTRRDTFIPKADIIAYAPVAKDYHPESYPFEG